jgi:hypothetical protein
MRTIGAWVAVSGLILLFGPVARVEVYADDKDAAEMEDNPIYKHWSAFKVGASVTRREKVKFPPESEEGQRYHQHTLIKDTTYKLIESTPEKAVVEVTEMEHGRGSITESAPFKIIYLAKIKKGQGTPKEGYSKHEEKDVEVEIKGKTYKATLLETVHSSGNVTKARSVWLSDEIPGGILKDTYSQKEGDKVLSESSLEVLSVNIP